MNLKIVPYNETMRMVFEKFRNQALQEGNDSLIEEKLDPVRLKGQLLLCFLENNLVSISACEASHYTGDPEVSARICRYHVLKKYRRYFLFCGFQMLQNHCIWADKVGFQVVYFTQDIKNIPLNSLYQRKRKYSLGAKTEWFDNQYFKSFDLDKSQLFQVSPTSPLLQFVYSRRKDPDYLWKPPKGMVSMPQNIWENFSL